MTKAEFLDKLRMALSGKVSEALLQENMTYYNEYIDSQIRMGKSEADVMGLLGDPRLIARTIVQTNAADKDTVQNGGYREASADREDISYEDGPYCDAGYGNNYGGNRSSSSYGRNEVKVRTLPGWVWTILTILIVVCILSFVIKVVAFLLPIVLPVIIVLFLIKLFRDWLN